MPVAIDPAEHAPVAAGRTSISWVRTQSRKAPSAPKPGHWRESYRICVEPIIAHAAKGCARFVLAHHLNAACPRTDLPVGRRLPASRRRKEMSFLAGSPGWSFLHLAESGKLREPIIKKFPIGEPSELVDSFGRWTQNA
jgi:hypothetical protein